MRMSARGRSEAGLTLIETMAAITIFSIITIGTVPLLGTAMKGGASTRSGSVARNVATKSLERLRGLQYHVAYTSAPRKVDLLDHFFPGRTPALVPSVGTGYDAATQSFVTTCDSISTADACAALPESAEIPEGYVVEVRATFRSPANPAVTEPVPVGYAWNGADSPPSDLLEVKVAVTWSVGATARTYDLHSYLSARGRSDVPVPGGGGGGPAPTPAPGASVPNTVNLRAEARIDYGYEITTTYQDNQSPPRLSEFTGTLGTAVAYGEQLDSGSKAELAVRAGRLRIVRPADPAIPSDPGLDVDVSGAIFDARAPEDATTTATTTAAAATATTSEVPATIASLAASEAGTMTGTRGAGPTVAGGLPFVKGYYDLNGTSPMSPVSSAPTHFWATPQTSAAASGTDSSTNPLGLYPTSGATHKMITVSDYQISGNASSHVDPRGEVMVDSTPTSPAGSRMVTSTATIPHHGMILLFPMWYSASNNAYMQINQFNASVSCIARADPSATSSATGSWSANLLYMSYEGTNKRDFGVRLRQTTLPVQTRIDNPHVPAGSTNPLQLIRNLNNGNGPKIYDADQDPGDSSTDAYLFAANGKRGMLTGWSQGSVQTSISADDRVASAQLNGAIRLETSPFFGPWVNSQKPQSDLTFAMGKLGCRAEDYR